MERIRQSFRRKKNKHKQQTESTFEADAVFDSAEAEEDPKPLSRIQKIRHSIRKLKKKNKHKNSDEDSDPVDDDNDKFTVDNNEEETCDDKVDEYSDKDEIDDVPLEKKSRFRLSFRKKKNKDKDDITEHVQLKIKKDKKKKKGSGKWENDEERVRSNHCEFKVNYLGFLEVQESRGMEVCETAVKSLLHAKQKPTKCKLHVAGDGLRVVDKKGGMLVDQVIEKVSFCAPDRNHHHGFAYISRDGTSRRWLCHGFMARRDSGERLSHAVGVAFAVCLESKQAREREGVTASYDEEEGTFTRFGSFRQATITERLQNPQEFKESVAKPPPEDSAGCRDNPFAIARPRPGSGDIRSSVRGLGDIRGASPFKRGGPDYSSLRVNELPSNISRKEKSRVSLILEENFENEETKNEINELLLQMSRAKVEDEMKTSLSSHFSAPSPTDSSAQASSVPFSVPNSVSAPVVSELSLAPSPPSINNNSSECVTKEAAQEADNPWDLVPDQPKIKNHSRSNSKHENIKLEAEAAEAGNQGDKWLASLTDKISSLEESQAARGWSSSLATSGLSVTEPAEDADSLDTEWAALANRNTEVKSAAKNNNPFIAFV